MMRILLPYLICLASLSLASTGQAQDSKQFVAKAQLWPYASICKFPDSDNWPSLMTYLTDVKTTITGCSDLEKKLGHPSAVRLTIVNLGDSKLDFHLQGLSSIILAKKSGKKLPALAWRQRHWNPTVHGTTTAFANELTGEVIVSVDPATACDFMFLFPNAEVGDLVSIPAIKPVKIAD
jgi:hypothetical protein